LIAIPDVPSFNEWVMLIQQNAAQAKQLLIGLKARNKQQGLLADPSLQISIEDYDRAQSLVTKATTDSAQAERIDRIARLGQATAGPFPDREDWIAMIKDDPDFARSVFMALQGKQGMFGLATPQAIVISIAAYSAVTGERSILG
jgi:hypothetical protein